MKKLLYLLLMILTVASVSAAACTNPGTQFTFPTYNVSVGTTIEATVFNFDYSTGNITINQTSGPAGGVNVAGNPQTISSLPSQEKFDFSFSQAGTYSFEAILDNGTSTCEVQNANNLTSNSNVTAPNIAIDLIAPVSTTVGNNVVVNYTISNTGGNATDLSGTFTSTSGTVSNTAVPSTLEGGDSHQGTMTISGLTCSGATAEFTLSFDDANGIVQTQQITSESVSVVGSDLEVSLVSASPLNLTEGEQVNLSAVIENTESQASNATTVRFRANSITGTVLATVNVPSIASSGSYTANATWVATTGVTTIVAEVVAVSNECDTTNNANTLGGSVVVTGTSSPGGSSGGSSGGGGGGGRRGDTYTLDFTGVTSADLTVRGQDRIYYTYEGQVYTISIPYVARDEVLLTIDPISAREYVDMASTWNVDLNQDNEADIGITPHSYSAGRVTLTFENLAVPEKPDYSNIPLIGTFLRGLMGDDNDREPASADAQGTLEIDEEFEENTSSPVKDTLTGLVVMLIIIGGGLGLYFYLRK